MTAEAEVYRCAASLIREYGWKQGDYGNEDEGFCTEGGVRRAVGLCFAPLSGTYMQNVLCHLKELEKLCDGEYVPAWNDDKRRAVEDVLTLLEQAATEAEKATSRCSDRFEGGAA